MPKLIAQYNHAGYYFIKHPIAPHPPKTLCVPTLQKLLNNQLKDHPDICFTTYPHKGSIRLTVHYHKRTIFGVTTKYSESIHATSSAQDTIIESYKTDTFYISIIPNKEKN